jgi:hypothetical protein
MKLYINSTMGYELEVKKGTFIVYLEVLTCIQ